MRPAHLTLIGILLFLVCLSAGAVGADAAETGPALICAPAELLVCSPDGKCTGVSAASVDFPEFLKIDFEHQTIRGILDDGTIRIVKIAHWQRFEDKLVLHGVQNGRGWSLVLTEPQGDMTIAVSEWDAGYMVFGSCVIP